MTAHAKVTSLAHTASGMGQVWYRVTGTTGVANRQVAYRAGVGAEDVRRVRIVGAGATAQLLGFRPGELVTSAADLTTIEEAFTTPVPGLTDCTRPPPARTPPWPRKCSRRRARRLRNPWTTCS